MKANLLKTMLIAGFSPVFFNQSGLFKGNTYDLQSFALPVSLFISFLAIFFLNKRVLKNNYVLIIFIICCLFIFLGGVAVSGSISPLLLLIYIVPMFNGVLSGYFFSKVYFFNRKEALDIIYLPYIYISLFSFLHIASSFLSLGISGAFINRGEDQIFGLFSIYQKLVYYPTLLSMGFFLGLALLKSRKTSIVQNVFMKIGILFICLDILIIGSRESMVLLLAGLLAWMWVGSYKKALFPILVFLLLIFIFSQTIVDFISRNDSFVFLSKWILMFELGEYTGGRAHVAQEVFSLSLGDFNILFGTFFSLALGDIRTPHNQYLELLLRSGIIGSGIFLIYSFLIIFRSFYFILRKEKDYFKFYISSLVIAMFLISFNINTPLRSPLVSFNIMFFTTFVSSCFIRRNKA